MIKTKIPKVALSLCLLVAGVTNAFSATVTYAFMADVPTIDGVMAGSFTLTVPNYIKATSLTQFAGDELNSCSAPGVGPCLTQFSIGPSPLGGQADRIGFGDDVCCFIYVFLEGSFETPGTYKADSAHSAGQAKLTVSVMDAPEPATVGLSALALTLVGISLRRRRKVSTTGVCQAER